MTVNINRGETQSKGCCKIVAKDISTDSYRGVFVLCVDVTVYVT